MVADAMVLEIARIGSGGRLGTKSIAVPVPAAPTVSMKYSPAAISEAPVSLSSAVALIRTFFEPLLGFGVTERALVSGPTVSVLTTKTELTGPQLPAASRPRT